MIIKKEIIERLIGRRDVRKTIEIEMSVTRFTLRNWLRSNIENGPLTSVKAVNIISKGLNVEPDEIFELEAETA